LTKNWRKIYPNILNFLLVVFVVRDLLRHPKVWGLFSLEGIDDPLVDARRQARAKRGAGYSPYSGASTTDGSAGGSSGSSSGGFFSDTLGITSFLLLFIMLEYFWGYLLGEVVFSGDFGKQMGGKRRGSLIDSLVNTFR
jgi:hypothetical protein